MIAAVSKVVKVIVGISLRDTNDNRTEHAVL